MSYTNVYPTRINWENDPSINTPINETNLNKMDYALYEHDRTFATWDTTKANQSDLLLSVKTIDYDDETGEFVFTWQNGTTKTVDLNIEKIPVSFSMNAQGVITMTTDDGTQYTADVGSLIKTYTFTDSSVIDFTVTTDASGNKTVTADIVDGSITGTKLQPNYLADCSAAKTAAETAQGFAEDSAEDSEAWAVGERGGVPVGPTDPTYNNNSKYWAEQAPSNSLATLTDVNLTTPTNNQVLGYNSTDQEWVNMDAPSGGLLPHLFIDSEAGSTVTVVTPDSEVIIPTQISSGHWECDVDAYGVYIIHSVLNGTDATLSLTVDDVKEYHVTDNHYSYTLSVYAPTGSMIRVQSSGETYTDTGAGSTAVVFALHEASTVYTITVTVDNCPKSTTITTPAATGQSGSSTIEFGTINLTFDDEFRSSTITCTDGTTTITKTAPSSGNTMTFYPPNTGNWSISGAAGGVTYTASPDPIVVSSLSTAVSANLQTFATINVTLYGAKEDTITFTDAAGVAHTEVFASGQTSKSVTLKILPSGSTIAFTSLVAKNPSNLSQNYSKNVSLTQSTTSVYVMPDRAVYWYGYNEQYVTYDQPNSGDVITFNTNNITIATNPIPQGGYFYSGVIFNKEIIASDHYLKMIGKTQSSDPNLPYQNMIQGSCANFVSENVIQGGYYQSNSAPPITDTLYTYDLTGTNHVNRYPMCARNGGTGVICALWLE